jgi:hypothetical protein
MSTETKVKIENLPHAEEELTEAAAEEVQGGLFDVFSPRGKVRELSGPILRGLIAPEDMTKVVIPED